ncbi:MAG: hypothetical protein QOE90_892 [Thermoplasmata archaeon]|jgi:hypothetical protein|nr:hypothetical protein [Thermoplasmata archaeon]
MKLAPLLPALLLLVPALAAPAIGQDVFPLQVPGTDVYLSAPPDRAFNLVMSGTTFNLQEYPGTHDALILEAYVGEKVQLTVTVPATAETHTFHLHGHPWFDPSAGRTVDTRMIRPGEAISFTVVAGGVDAHDGDWMYHCHFAQHAAAGMWGLLRVYPYAMHVPLVPPDAAGFDITVDRLGAPLEDARVMLDVEGHALPASVTPLGQGRYHVAAALPAHGVLTVMAHGPLGATQARIGLGGTIVPPLTTSSAMTM